MTSELKAKLAAMWAKVPPRDPDCPTMREVMGEEEYDRFCEAWERAVAMPELPDWYRWADEGCMDLCRFSFLDGCTKEEQDRILVAALDAAPRGEEAVRQAAAEMLHSLAAIGGWQDFFGFGGDESPCEGVP